MGASAGGACASSAGNRAVESGLPGGLGARLGSLTVEGTDRFSASVADIRCEIGIDDGGGRLGTLVETGAGGCVPGATGL